MKHVQKKRESFPTSILHVNLFSILSFTFSLFSLYLSFFLSLSSLFSSLLPHTLSLSVCLLYRSDLSRHLARLGYSGETGVWGKWAEHVKKALLLSLLEVWEIETKRNFWFSDLTGNWREQTGSWMKPERGGGSCYKKKGERRDKEM